MATKIDYEIKMDMTPMIDCVFQLMIFFIVTFKLDADLINPDIQLAKSPHGPTYEKKEPGMIVIQIDKRGVTTIGQAVVMDTKGNGMQVFQGILQQAVNKSGYGIPIMIRADRETRHLYVRRVMDVCTSVGLWRIKFAGLKRRAS